MATTQMPWLQLFKGGTDAETLNQNQAIGLTKYVITYNLWLYLRADPTGVINAETTINNIVPMRLIKRSRRQTRVRRQTLGRLVTNAWINGGSDWGREMDDENIVVVWKITVETGI